MNARRRKCNLRMDQLRRRLHRGDGSQRERQLWAMYIRHDREVPPLRPLGQLSWIVRTNLRGRDGRHETDTAVRNHMRRILAAVRNHEPLPTF